MSSFIDFNEIKVKVPIDSAIALLGLQMKQSNGQWRGVCPVCKSGGERALVITPAKSAYYCFGAKKGGDVIALVSHLKELSPKDAAHFLAGKGTVQSGTVPATAPPEQKAGLNPLTYLVADHEAVRALGIEPETAQEWGAGFSPKGIMRGRFAIPIKSRQGELLAYVGIAVKDDLTPRLLLPNGFDGRGIVFGADRLVDGEFRLVSDPLQVLLTQQLANEITVCFLTETVSSEQVEILAALMDQAKAELIP